MSSSAERSAERNRRPDTQTATDRQMISGKDKKTCPEGIILIQIGTIEQSVSPAVLAEIAAEFFEEFERAVLGSIHILDWSLRLDETAFPHCIHKRHVFDCENVMVRSLHNRKKHWKRLVLILPEIRIRSRGKLNNRKKTF